MRDISLDELLKKTGSMYKLVILAARRAIELGDGAAKLVDTPQDTKIGDIALIEIAEGKISYKVKGEEK